jgi:hypothetical protein
VGAFFLLRGGAAKPPTTGAGTGAKSSVATPTAGSAPATSGASASAATDPGPATSDPGPATTDPGPDPSAVAGDIFLREMQLDSDIAAAATKVNGALGKARPSSPVLESSLRELVTRADGLQAEAQACSDERAGLLSEAAGYHSVRAQALVDGYLAWYAGDAYQAYFQAGHDAKYKGLGYDEGSGQPTVGGLWNRVMSSFGG